MDASCGSISSEKKILSEEQGVDRLSSLPDDVLHHIISLLTTEDVVRSSVLSTRLQHFCSTVANIDLGYVIPYNVKDKEQRKRLKKSFLEFVDRVLILRDASKIRKLCLVFPIRVNDFRLHRWICAIIKHKVEDIELNLMVEGDSGLPPSLFTCRSLVVLELSVKATLEAPIATYLPNLKKLHLSEVSFMGDLSVECLFSNCPVLDELVLVECDWQHIENVTVSVPTLRNLVIIGDADSVYISNSHIKIVAANLACLNFSSHLDVGFEWSDLSSLKTASVDLPYYGDIEEEVASRALRLFLGIHNVESLTLSTITVEYLMNVEACLDHLPMFHNLTCLTVNSKFYARCSVFLLAFLEKMPKLEYLDLSEGFHEDECISLRDDLTQQRVPSCFNSSLRNFAFADFHAKQNEMVLLEYVLRYATGLKYLSISCSIGLQEETLSEAKDRLLNVPRGSESCNIEFSFPYSE